MPSGIVTAEPMNEPGTWVQQALFAAFGAGTPREGMVFSGLLFVLVFSWTAIGLVFTIFLDVIFAVLFVYNFARAVAGWLRSR